MTLYCRAGRQHGACSETFWASCIMLFVFPGRDGRVTGSIESLPESEMVYVRFLPLLTSISTLCWKQPTSLIWPFFLCVAWEQKKCASLTCYHCLSPTPSLCIHSSLSNLLSLPFFYVSVLMIYFCKNVRPVLTQSLKCLLKRGIHVNYSYLRQALS